MKKSDSIPTVTLNLVFRVLLGALFIISGFAKLSTPVYYFAHSIEQFQMLPESLIVIMSYTLPWIELMCGILLILGFFMEGSLLIINLMLVVFIIAVSRATLQGLKGECGCFGPLSNSEIGWKLVIQDVLLLTMGLCLFFKPSSFLTLEAFLDGIKGRAKRRR
jgi:uncharacterized membrane protein YphA (DoxX/SURF4 family)